MVLLFCLVLVNQALSQEKMYIHKSDNFTLGALISETDSIYFSNDGLISYFRIGDTLAQYQTSKIDSLTFGENSTTIFITYNGSGVKVINPLAFEGVSVAVSGADVIVNTVTEMQDINYSLTGTTADGMFKIYSTKRYNLLLNGVHITNPDGPAINIQSEKKTSVIIVDGTNNSISDGITYAPPAINGNGKTEDQDAAFFSEAKLVFGGTGLLEIEGNGADQHALCSDDIIEINGSNIIITKAAKDGIHANDGILISDGTLLVTASGDAIDGDAANIAISGGSITTSNAVNNTKGICCDSTLMISGGILNLTVTGNGTKAIKSNQALNIIAGSITIHTSGSAVLEPSGLGYDPSYCTAIKCDAAIQISGGEITVISTGQANKALSSDTDIEITGGTLQITNSGIGSTYLNSAGITDAIVATCLSADGDISIAGGTVTASSSGKGGKGISGDGLITIGNTNTSPIVNVTTTGTRLYVSGSGNNTVYAEAKAIKSDGALTINNGIISIASADDGIKSETSVTVNTSSVTISNSTEGIEAPYITLNNGNVNVASSDDCFNATFGNGGENDDGSILTINGGNVVASTSGGDGLDSNGDMVFTGGAIIVHGPPSAPEVGMDFNGTCNMNGGFLVVSGTNSNMTQAPDATSTQYCIMAKSNSSISSSTLFHIQDAAATNIVTFQPVRNYYSIIFSSADLQNGSTYSIYTGGTSTGTNTNGLYSGGVYSGGTLKKTFTIGSIITNVTF